MTEVRKPGGHGELNEHAVCFSTLTRFLFIHLVLPASWKFVWVCLKHSGG